MRPLLHIALAVLTVPAIAQTAAPTFTLNDARALGDTDTAQFYAGNTSPLWDAFSDELKASMKDPAGLQNAQHTIAENYGKETAVLHESVILLPPHLYSYTRIVQYEQSEQNYLVQWAFSPDGKTIEGFGIHLEPNPAITNFADYKDKTAINLPVSGAWTVYQGGLLVGDNYHSTQINERFAMDICMLKDGQLYSGDGTKNEDFYSFGQPVIAPAAGKIVSADDSYADSDPGKGGDTDPAQGNSIVIDHGDGEFSMIGSLKSGSIKVKVGDTVKADEVIAAVGHTGNSPMAHLTYHLQNTSKWMKGEGLPIQFQHLLVDGKLSTVTPTRGDIIESKAEATK